MNAFNPTVFIACAARRAVFLAAAVWVTIPLHSTPSPNFEFSSLTTGITSGATDAAPRPPLLDGGWPSREPGRSATIRTIGAKGAVGGSSLYSSLKYVTFCFGPLFGNAGRGVDPNFMPPPMASYGGGGEASNPSKAIRYTRVPSNAPGRVTWIGADGSRISYVSASPAGLQQEPEAFEDDKPSVAKLIAEHRRELTRISWSRVYKRYPELAKDGPDRAAFERHVAERRADPRQASAFESPMWPEALASAFSNEVDWKRAEEASWERVHARIRSLNDRDGVYTRSFLSLAEDLRGNPQQSSIFAQPDWPEKVLELHEQSMGLSSQRLR